MKISKNVSLVVLGVTAIVCSRAMFVFFNDPEGPNLLIVLVMAVIVYVLSYLAVRFLTPSISGLKRILWVVFIQVIIVTVIYFFLR